MSLILTPHALTGASWDVSTAGFVQNFSVGVEDTNPTGLFFKPDGAKMYVTGNDGNDVNEYDLATPWNISTAVFLQSFSVAAQETSPTDVFFRADGLKMFVVGTSLDSVIEYSLSSAWNVSTAAFVQSKDISAQELGVNDVFFKPDGTKMYIVGNGGIEVNEYDLVTPWDVSTASFLQLLSVAAQDVNPSGVFFKPDGTKMFVLGNATDAVLEYALSSAWNISTASYTRSFSVAAQDAQQNGLYIRADGLKLYTIGSGNDRVYEYNMS